MKKYVFTFFLFCISLFLIDNAYAKDFDGWGMQVIHPSKVNAYNCDSSKCATSLSVADNYITDADNNFVYSISATTPSVLTSTNGIMWIHNVQNILQSGYLYSITGYFCNTGGKNYKILDLRTANNQANIYNKVYNLTYSGASAVNSISGNIADNGSSNFTCNYINKIFSPSVSSQYLGWQVTTQSSYTGSQYFVGYTIEPLGVYSAVTTDDINSAISNSGLATAQSVEEVKQAEQEIKTELKNTQQSIDNQTQQQNKNHKETMDYMKDETDIDTSKVDSLVGYLPAGPLDSIINLPLSMLNSINTNLSNTCVAPTFKVPFINEDFTLPCISALYDKMGATTLLNTFGVIAAAVMLYKYFVYLYNWIDSVLSLKGNKLKGWGE